MINSQYFYQTSVVGHTHYMYSFIFCMHLMCMHWFCSCVNTVGTGLSYPGDVRRRSWRLPTCLTLFKYVIGLCPPCLVSLYPVISAVLLNLQTPHMALLWHSRLSSNSKTVLWFIFSLFFTWCKMLHIVSEIFSIHSSILPTKVFPQMFKKKK